MADKVYWVTGASSGIGEALAIELSLQGHDLIISARRKSELERVRNLCKYKKRVKILPLDLEKHEDLAEKATQAISLYGKVDVLINNAGVSQRSLITETIYTVDKRMVDINFLGTITLSKALLPHFIKNKQGHFVTVTSIMGKFGSPWRSAYCGAKHGLHGFFDVLRMEHEQDGVKVTMVCPGFVKTNVAFNALKGDGKTQKTQDSATQNGMDPSFVAKKIMKAVKRNRFEVYIGRKEILGVYVKRFFPRLLHRMVLKSSVR